MVNLALPDNLFIQHRLTQEGPLEFRLTPKFRDSLAATLTPETAPILPAPADYALDEAAALSVYYGRLIDSAAGPQLFEQQLPRFIERLQALAERAPDGAIASILLCRWQDYMAHHAVNTALLACKMAQHLQFPAPTVQILLLAALTMNLGAKTLHNEMSRQESPPTTLQRQLLKAHPFISSALLREGGLADPLLHTLLLTHHERLDGRGYPFGLKQEDIDPLAHLLHLLDITIAKLMPRAHRAAMPVRQALAETYYGIKESFDSDGTMRLVKVLGIYPPGSFVLLESGAKAIVVKRSRQAHAPLVAMPSNHYQLTETTEPGYRISKSIGLNVPPRILPLLAPLWRMEQREAN
jgi:HD-GYP domain-containing protein (c-di-GMP phosphodiesterase class II)